MKTATEIHNIIRHPRRHYQGHNRKKRTKTYRAIYSESPIEFIDFHVKKGVIDTNRYYIDIDVPGLVHFIKLEYRSRKKATYEKALNNAIRWDGGSALRQIEYQLNQQKANAQLQAELKGKDGYIKSSTETKQESHLSCKQLIISNLTLREKGLDYSVARFGHKLDDTIAKAETNKVLRYDLNAVARKTVELQGYRESDNKETYDEALRIAIKNAVRAYSIMNSNLIRNHVFSRRYSAIASINIHHYSENAIDDLASHA